MKYADIQIKRLGLADYLSTWRAMQDFTLQRDAASADELWLTQHEPVYTLGLAGKSEHLLEENGIPLVKVDRGGQITYHGPGQLVLYLLLDLKRRGLGVRELVGQMEHAVMDLLGRYGVTARLRPGAPGVYVDGAKVAALGLRVRRGCCYHGIAFNVDMDLAPFQAINPCGYPGLRVTQARDLGIRDNIYTLGDELAGHLQARLHATRTGH